METGIASDRDRTDPVLRCPMLAYWLVVERGVAVVWTRRRVREELQSSGGLHVPIQSGRSI